MSTANSDVNELLRYMLIVDPEKVTALEKRFPGDIRLGPAGRYGCRLLAKGVMVEFTLGTLPDGSENFLVTENGNPLGERPRNGKDFFLLVRHRAAEAMFAVRAGHTEYNIRRHPKKKRERA